MKRLFAVLVLASATAAAGAAGDLVALSHKAPGGDERLNVYAAASLTEVFERIDSDQAYNFAGSNQLAFQIRQGAPVDVFASASPSYTQSLFRDGLVERPRTFASNTLVLAVPKSNPARVTSVYDLARKDVKLVIGTPRVPVGFYTREVLRRLGLSQVLAKVVSQEPDAKGVVGKLALGEADAGFVYSSARLLLNPQPEPVRKLKDQVLLWMLLGLVGFLLGGTGI